MNLRKYSGNRNVFFLIFILLVIIVLVYRNGKNPILLNILSSDEYDEVLKQFNQSATYCEHLVKDWSKYNMSKEYYSHYSEFEARIKRAIEGVKDSEGHTNQIPEQMIVLHLLARVSSVKTVCETGFNYGHSSYNYLTANPKLKVHSFDIGHHGYSRRMAKSLQEIFSPERLTVYFGDSTVEVPKAKSAGKLPLCDLIFVDGGHTYPVAKADLINFASHASEKNIVIFDDYPTNWGMGMGKCWEELLINPGKIERPIDTNSKMAIKEVMRCIKMSNSQRGFVIGKVLLNR